MKKLTASIIGRDRPGVIATVSSAFGDMRCSIVELSQTILAGEFAAIFVVQAPDDLDEDTLRASLETRLERDGMDMSVLLRPSGEGAWGDGRVLEPFVVAADGPDQPGEIAAISRVFGRHGVNADSLKAVLGDDGHALFVFEISVPEETDLGRLRRELIHEGERCGLRVSMQHRDIFEAMHRVAAN